MCSTALDPRIKIVLEVIQQVDRATIKKIQETRIIKQETILNLINQIRIKTTMRKSELKILKDDNNNFRLCFAKLSNILFLYKNLFFNGFHSHLILSVK